MSKTVIQPFEEYQKCRIMFVQTVAELANRPKHIESLKNVKVMDLLAPLLNDPVTSIKQSAALAIGRLAKHSKELAYIVVEEDGKIIKQLLESYENHNAFYKKATCFVISSVSRHSLDLAKKITEYNCVSFLINCLYEYDSSVKEAAVWALGYIAQHSEELAIIITNDNKAVEYLILCLLEPETNIKRITIQTISHIAKHSEKLTDIICSKQNLDYIISYLENKDILLKHKVCTCLANMTRRSNNVAKVLGQNNIILVLKECLDTNELQLQKSTITLLNEIASKGSDYAIIINDRIKSNVVCNFLKVNSGQARLFALPYIATIIKIKEEIARDYIKQENNLLDTIAECIIEDSIRVNRIKTDKEEEIESEIKSLACEVINNLTLHDKADGDLVERSNADEICKFDIHNDLLILLAIKCSDDEFLKKSIKTALLSIINKIRDIYYLETLVVVFLNVKYIYDYRYNRKELEFIIRKIKGEDVNQSSFNFNKENTKLFDNSYNAYMNTNSLKNTTVSFNYSLFEELLVSVIKRTQDIFSQDTSELNPTKAKFLRNGTMSNLFILQKNLFPNINESINDYINKSIFKEEYINIYNKDYINKIIKEYDDGNKNNN